MRTRLAVLILFALIFRSQTATADSTVVVSRYSLDATFKPELARIEAVATMRFVCQGSLPPAAVCFLHGELSVDSVRLGNRPITIEQKPVFYDYDYSLIANQIAVPLSGASCDSALTIYYSGYFHASRARSQSDYMRIDEDGVFLRAYGYSPWFPMFVSARSNCPNATFDRVLIHTPAEFRSVFTGTQLSDSVREGWRTTIWNAVDVALTGAQCTAQRYTVTTAGNCFVYCYTDSSSKAAGAQILQFATAMNDLYGKYYRKGTAGEPLYVIEMPPYGDISSGNVTGLMASTWKIFADDANAKRALAHELVHPYTAVPVDRSDPMYCYAIEGFPSYFHLPVLAEVLGTDVYDRFIDWMEKLYLEKRQTGRTRWGAVPPEKPLLAIKADELSTYKDEYVLDDRALLFMNYLYRHLGRKRFFTFTSDLLNKQKLTAETFRQTVLKYLPGATADVDLWLSTTEYPDRFHLDHLPSRKK